MGRTRFMAQGRSFVMRRRRFVFQGALVPRRRVVVRWRRFVFQGLLVMGRGRFVFQGLLVMRRRRDVAPRALARSRFVFG